MITHVMICSNDFERAKTFCDVTFVALGGRPGEMDARGGCSTRTREGG